jgi:hypothetical protein
MLIYEVTLEAESGVTISRETWTALESWRDSLAP